jgi:hypothetical protein
MLLDQLNRGAAERAEPDQGMSEGKLNIFATHRLATKEERM